MEDLAEADKKIEQEKLNESVLNMSQSFASDMIEPKEKITFALELAIAEITKKKKRTQEGEAEEDEDV